MIQIVPHQVPSPFLFPSPDLLVEERCVVLCVASVQIASRVFFESSRFLSVGNHRTRDILPPNRHSNRLHYFAASVLNRDISISNSDSALNHTCIFSMKLCTEKGPSIN